MNNPVHAQCSGCDLRLHNVISTMSSMFVLPGHYEARNANVNLTCLLSQEAPCTMTWPTNHIANRTQRKDLLKYGTPMGRTVLIYPLCNIFYILFSTGQHGQYQLCRVARTL